jgi:hypothetical protein
VVVDVIVPALGESERSVAVSRWLKQPGDQVRADEPIVELETDEASIEVLSPAAGRLDTICVESGERVEPGQVLARVGEVADHSPGQGVGAPRKLDILEFFEAEAKRHDELWAATQSRAAVARAELPALVGEVSAAKAALEDKVALKERAEREGLDASKLQGPIGELRAQLQAASERYAGHQAAIDAAQPRGRRTFERELALARSLRAHLRCWTAVEVSDVRECYPYVVVKVTEADATGQPTALAAAFGRSAPYGLRVMRGPRRVSSKFCPKALSWLPESPADKSDPEPVEVFIDCARGVLFVPTTYVEGHFFGGDEYRQLLHADLAVSLDRHLEEHLGNLRELDLDRPCAGNELAEVVRLKALALTASSGPFRPTDIRLTSQEISSRVKDDWNAFISCPWGADVTGALALLKYHAENGEKPRLWCEGHEGHYGFRLRTRDHTWLVGELFVMPDEPPPSGREPLVVTPSPSGGTNVVARLGRFHLNVGERR